MLWRHRRVGGTGVRQGLTRRLGRGAPGPVLEVGELMRNGERASSARGEDKEGVEINGRRHGPEERYTPRLLQLP